MFGSWRHLIEDPVLLGDIKQVVEKGSVPSFGFFFMLAASGVIATFGLLSNSAAVIIGAMIVAPLMNPIVSLSFGGVEVNRVLIFRSLLTIVIGTIVIVTMAFLVSDLIGWKLAGSELIARMSPSLLDLGIAVAAGAAVLYGIHVIADQFWFFHYAMETTLEIAAIHASPWTYDSYVPLFFAGNNVPAQQISRPVTP